jgi:hypothetical protein
MDNLLIKRVLLLFVLSLFLLIPSFFVYSSSPEKILDEWYSTHSRADRYLGIREPLIGCFYELDNAGIPLDLLLERLNEGASKRVRPAILSREMDAEKERLFAAQRIIEEADTGDKGGDDLNKTLKHLSVYLRSGLSESTLLFFMKGFSGSGTNKDDLFALFYLFARLHAIKPMQQDLYFVLGKALLEGEYSTLTFDTLASLYLQAQAKGIPADQFVEIAIDTLHRQEDLSQLAREIERRARR